jgi:hypothetical protein
MSMKIVRVVWDDAEDPSEGKTWLDGEDVDTFSKHDCTVESIGYLVSKTAKYVTLAADWIDELKHWGRVTKIPTGMVTKFEEIGYGPDSVQDSQSADDGPVGGSPPI